jgi:hypothetical protein
MRHHLKEICAVSGVALAFVTAGSVVPSAQLQGPSTQQTSYVLPDLSTVWTSSIASVGDQFGKRMVGIPDGLGAFDNGDGTFTLVMNHELSSNVGVARAHGSKGSFVSKWIIRQDNLSVVSNEDLMQRVYRWDSVNQRSQAQPSTFAFNRFCSGDLAKPTAFYNPATGKGTTARIYMNGEEGGNTGIQLAHVVTGPDAGSSYELGKFNLATNGSGVNTNPPSVAASENSLASPYPQDKTIVIVNSDGGNGLHNNAVTVYVGTKQTTGSDVDKAGLTNGVLKFVNVTGNTKEILDNTSRATGITNGTRFTLSAASSTTFSRPEDGAWNPLNPREYYFVTTDQLDQVADGVGAQIGQTRLWRLTFDDITNPDRGGKIDLLIDGRKVGADKVNMFDNIAVNEQNGVIVLLEDVGNAAHNGKVWLYDPSTDELTQVAHHDVARFGDIGIAATAPFNQDEETSGVIDMSSILGPGMYLFDDQAHYLINTTTPRGFTNPNELVEGGQLMVGRFPLPVAEDKDRCKKGGFESLFREDGGTFKNQGDCVSYTNTGK